MAVVDFKKLLEHSLQLTQETGIDAENIIQRNPEQLFDGTQRLAEKSSRAGDVAKNKAHFLLAEKGFDAEKLSRELNAINIKTNFEPLEALAETDLDGYLRHERQMIALTALEETKRETSERFRDTFLRNMEAEWETTKAATLEALGHKTGIFGIPSASPAQNTPSSHSHNGDAWSSPFVSGGSGGGPPPASASRSNNLSVGQRGKTGMDRKMLTYARVICLLNEKRQQPGGHPFGLTTSLQESQEEISPNPAHDQVVGCWDLLRCMVNEQQVVRGEFKHMVLRESHYQKAYQQQSLGLRRFLVAGARKFLEKQYADFVKQAVAQDRREAQLGGKLGFERHIRAFLTIYPHLLPNGGQFSAGADEPDCDATGLPIWPQLFFCLRCGKEDAALRIARENAAVLGNFAAFLQEYIHQVSPASGDVDREPQSFRPPDGMWQMIINDYRRFVRQRSDPYMHACYTLLGRCEVGVGVHSQILTSAQDFLWFKLALVRETNEVLPHLFLRHDYRLQQLQELVLDHGPAHFSADGTQPLLYFQVLLATQQFEEAIRYLLSSSQHQVDAVHFAVALYYYGLLSLPPPDSAPRDLLYGQGSGVDDAESSGGAAGRPWINMERLLRQYVRLFAATDPLDAMQYLNLLQDPSQKAVAMRDLVLQTREFEVLLGAVRGDGTRQPGCIDRFLPPHEARNIMELAAHAALERGLHQDAVQLYFKAANYDRVVAILNQQMSRMLTGQPGADRSSVVETGASDVAGAMPQHSDSERDRLFTLANVLYSRHGSLLSSVRHRDLLRTFHLLRRLGKFFDHYHRHQFAEALQTATSIGLVPVSTAEMAEKVDAFRALDPTILRNFAEILIAHMTVLHSLYSMITPSSPAVTPQRGMQGRFGSEQELRTQYREQARALVMFSGMIQFRMPGDANSRLVQLSVFMS